MAGLALYGWQAGGNATKRRARRGQPVRFTFGKAVALFVTVVFLMGIVICGPAEHAALETETSVASQVMASNVQAPAVVKVAGDHKVPAKKPLATCTGHCSAHSISLPASFSPQTAAFEDRAAWRPVQDQGLLIERSVLLDRPPRA